MSQRKRKASYWQEAPIPREQLVLIPTALEEMIPPEHPVRLVDEILELMDWTSWESAYHGRCGQPPIHPSVMAKVLLFAMIRRIRSSRSIEYELKHSIDFMWLTGGRHIDHSTLSIFRRKHKTALKDIFQQMVKLAIKLKVANLAEICIDGTRILGDANKYKTWTAERLAKALKQLDSQLAEALEALDINDVLDEDLLGQDISADRLPAAVADIKSRREELAKHKQTLEAMDKVRKQNGTKGPAQLPKTDPDSRILPSKEGGYAANYTPMVTTESQGGLIVNADVMIGNVEHHQLSSIIDCLAKDYEADIERVLVDSAYTTGKNLSICEDKQIDLIGPLAEPSHENNPAEREDPTSRVPEDRLDDLPVNPQTKRFDKAAFVYDEQLDCYFCPAGKILSHRTTEKSKLRGGTPVQVKVYTCYECEGCELASRCRKNVKSTESASSKSVDGSESSEPRRDEDEKAKQQPSGDPQSKRQRGREVKNDEHEGARQRHREKMQAPEAQQAYSRRQHTGETPFAVIKHMFDFRRFLLRGIEGVSQEWQWAATAFNLKKLMSHIAKLRAENDKATIAEAN